MKKSITILLYLLPLQYLSNQVFSFQTIENSRSTQDSTSDSTSDDSKIIENFDIENFDKEKFKKLPQEIRLKILERKVEGIKTGNKNANLDKNSKSPLSITGYSRILFSLQQRYAERYSQLSVNDNNFDDQFPDLIFKLTLSTPSFMLEGQFGIYSPVFGSYDIYTNSLNVTGPIWKSDNQTVIYFSAVLPYINTVKVRFGGAFYTHNTKLTIGNFNTRLWHIFETTSWLGIRSDTEVFNNHFNRLAEEDPYLRTGDQGMKGIEITLPELPLNLNLRGFYGRSDSGFRNMIPKRDDFGFVHLGYTIEKSELSFNLGFVRYQSPEFNYTTGYDVVNTAFSVMWKGYIDSIKINSEISYVLYDDIRDGYFAKDIAGKISAEMIIRNVPIFKNIPIGLSIYYAGPYYNMEMGGSVNTNPFFISASHSDISKIANGDIQNDYQDIYTGQFHYPNLISEPDLIYNNRMGIQFKTGIDILDGILTIGGGMAGNLTDSFYDNSFISFPHRLNHYELFNKYWPDFTGRYKKITNASLISASYNLQYKSAVEWVQVTQPSGFRGYNFYKVEFHYNIAKSLGLKVPKAGRFDLGNIYFLNWYEYSGVTTSLTPLSFDSLLNVHLYVGEIAVQIHPDMYILIYGGVEYFTSRYILGYTNSMKVLEYAFGIGCNLRLSGSAVLYFRIKKWNTDDFEFNERDLDGLSGDFETKIVF